MQFESSFGGLKVALVRSVADFIKGYANTKLAYHLRQTNQLTIRLSVIYLQLLKLLLVISLGTEARYVQTPKGNVFFH